MFNTNTLQFMTNIYGNSNEITPFIIEFVNERLNDGFSLLKTSVIQYYAQSVNENSHKFMANEILSM